MAPRSCAALAALVLTGGALASITLSASHSLELRGSTVFVRAPWKVDLVSYYTTVGQPWAEYFFTLDLPADAGASLGELLIQQTRGVDNQFPFAADKTRAFLGRPRRAGAAIPVQATFSQRERLMRVVFPEPVASGSTLTVRLKPWTNPMMADTYMFQVTAVPAGPNPRGSAVGFGTLRIYSPDWR